MSSEFSKSGDSLENEILYKIQVSFPLVERPFEVMAKELNSSEDEIIEIVKRNIENSIIRQISAIFDTKRLGYKSSLVAFKVKEENIDRAVEAINNHPGVSHNYLRDNDFNIWFTIAVPPDTELGLEKSVDILKERSNADEAIILPTKKLFKIAVKMDTTGKVAKREKVKRKSFSDIELTDRDIEIIKELQKNIEITQEPFKRIIDKLGISYSELFNRVEEFKKAGVMRRFAGILNHRRAGFNANAMSVWSVEDDRADEVGEKLASFSAVSHCYLRPKFENWPYNIFAMVHAKTKEESEALIKEMSKEVGVDNYSKLYSTKEFKKQRIVYFSDKFKEWEREALNN